MKKRFNGIKSNGVMYQGISLLVDPKAEYWEGWEGESQSFDSTRLM
jgi:hypothetical protein